QPYEENGNQRTVNHQARVALARRGIIAVIVDPMSVEGEGGEAEKQGWVGSDHARPRARRRWGTIPERGGGDRSACFAINDVLLLLDAGSAGLFDLMPDGDEHQPAAASSFVG